MTISKKILYKKLLTYEVDKKPVSLSFTDRLARENQWSTEFSRRVFVEYKKFIYLSSISTTQVTPSDQIDQVWHLHLTYTQSYWNDLCKNILEYKLHHNPTEGGNNESVKFNEQYKYTLELYENEFGEKPPQDIWPSTKERFRNADKFVRLNSSNHWLIKRPSHFFIPAILLTLFLAACTRSNGESGYWFYITIVIVVYVVYKLIKWLIKNIDKNNGGSGGAGCGGCGGCGG